MPGGSVGSVLETEPIGSVPRSAELLDALGRAGAGELSPGELDAVVERALEDTVARFVETGSPVITDGEQSKSSFVTYPLEGLANLAPDGAEIPFADGHTRRLPRLTAGPFRYGRHAEEFLRRVLPMSPVPVKQAVISVSALSLLYPEDGIDGYARERFLDDLVAEGVADIRGCLDAGAHRVQVDFTEGRLALKLDPSGELLRGFVELNNRVLGHFDASERARIGVHTCPGGDQDSTHSADVDYAGLLPELFRLDAGAFYLQMASEPDPERVLGIVAEHRPASATVFVGVIDPIDPRVESVEEVAARVMTAARHVPVDRLGTCDDCGFSPFGDDTSTSRDLAFAKIRARVEGTRVASERLGV